MSNDQDKFKYAKFIYQNLEKMHSEINLVLNVNKIFQIIKKGEVNCQDKNQLSNLVKSLNTTIQKKKQEITQQKAVAIKAREGVRLLPPTQSYPTLPTQQRRDLWQPTNRKPGPQTKDPVQRKELDRKELDNLDDRLGMTIEPPDNQNPEMDQRHLDLKSKNQFLDQSGDQYHSVPRYYNKFANMLKQDDGYDDQANQTDQFILMAGQRKMFSENRVTTDYFLGIDSKDRNYDTDTRPNQFSFRFQAPDFTADTEKGGYINRKLNNVISIELVKCLFKNTSSLVDASDNSSVPPYVILEIDEISDSWEGSNDSLNKASFILDYYETLGDFRYYKMPDLKTFTHYFEPMINLSKLTFSFRTPDGELYQFGADNDSVITTIVFLSLKITRLRKKLVSQSLEQN